MLSTHWAKALEPNIKEFVEDGYAEHTDWTPEIYNVSDDSSGIIRFHDSFGPASIPKSSEGADSTELSITPGYETVTRPQIFKAVMPITEELQRWNKYKGQILDRSRSLGLAAIQTVNRYGARIFIGGFTSTVTEYGDGEELFSVSHDRPDGGTAASNASGSGITLTEANLETALIAMREQVSGTGRHLAIGYNDNMVLMVPNNLEKEAQIITGSTKRSGTPLTKKGFLKHYYV